MSDTRRAQLAAITPEEVLNWMSRTGNGYRTAARHFAAEVMGLPGVDAEGADTGATDADVKYLSGRFHRWTVSAKANEEKGKGTNKVKTFAAGLAAAVPEPGPMVLGARVPREEVPGSLADLATDGSEEAWLEASLRQVEDAVAKRARKGLDITTLKRLATDLHRQLNHLRRPPAPSLDELPEDARQAILEAEVPSWPDYVLLACIEEAKSRGLPR